MSEPAINSSSVSQGDWRTVTMTDKSDWNAMYYVALGGDGHIHAPDDGWQEGVTIALTDAPPRRADVRPRRSPNRPVQQRGVGGGVGRLQARAVGRHDGPSGGKAPAVPI